MVNALPVVVTEVEDKELRKEMLEEFIREKKTLLKLPLPYSRERNPSNRGGNDTRKKPETKEFDQLLSFSCSRVH